MPRTGTPIVLVCIAVAVFAAFLPGLTGLDYAIFSPQWVVLADCSVVIIRPATEHDGEESFALLYVAPSRAPPTV